MVLVIPQFCPSLVSFHHYSFGLITRSLFSSLPVPFPDNIRSLSFSLFYSLPIPFPNNICVSICSLTSSLPDPFPSNSVLLFVLIGLALTHACPRLRLQPNPLVPQPCDSRFRPSSVSWTRHWISLDIPVCRFTTLDCFLFSEACSNKEYHFFIPEFRLVIGSCYPGITH